MPKSDRVCITRLHSVTFHHSWSLVMSHRQIRSSHLWDLLPMLTDTPLWLSQIVVISLLWSETTGVMVRGLRERRKGEPNESTGREVMQPRAWLDCCFHPKYIATALRVVFNSKEARDKTSGIVYREAEIKSRDGCRPTVFALARGSVMVTCLGIVSVCLCSFLWPGVIAGVNKVKTCFWNHDLPLGWLTFLYVGVYNVVA